MTTAKGICLESVLQVAQGCVLYVLLLRYNKHISYELQSFSYLPTRHWLFSPSFFSRCPEPSDRSYGRCQQ